MDEGEVIVRAGRGESAAWQHVVAAHGEAVFRLAYLILGDAGDAEDVAQETFVRAAGALHRFEAGRPLRPWLLAIAANLARNRRRSIGRYLRALARLGPAEPAARDDAGRDEEARELWEAARTLPADDQEIIYLRYFMELSVAETAETLRVAPGTVKSRLSRALGRLRAVVERDFPDLADGRDDRGGPTP